MTSYCARIAAKSAAVAKAVPTTPAAAPAQANAIRAARRRAYLRDAAVKAHGNCIVGYPRGLVMTPMARPIAVAINTAVNGFFSMRRSTSAAAASAPS
jgi:hypothetical protein